jgi:hypothetical protein
VQVLVIRKSTVVTRSSLPRRLFPPGHLLRPQSLRRLAGPHRVLDAEQVPHEVLHALAGGAEQVGPPDRHHAREVARVVWVLAGETQPAGRQLVHDVVVHRLARGGRLAGQVERVAVERRVRRCPAHPRCLGQRIGERAR